MKTWKQFRLMAIPVIFCLVIFTACDNGNGEAASNNNQTPVNTDYTIGNMNQMLSDVGAVTITPKQDKSNGTVTIYYDEEIELPSEAGMYAVTFNVAAAAGWNATNGLYAGMLYINDGEPKDPNVTVYTAGSYRYTGSTNTWDRACYWKDTEFTDLHPSNASATGHSYAYSVYVSGDEYLHRRFVHRH